MKTITLEAIERAVSSISMTSYPTFRAGSIEAEVWRANSPYVSRTTVKFERVEALQDGALFATSGKHSLLITTFEPEPGNLVPPFPVNNLVTDWEGGRIPSWVVRPVIDRMSQFSMCPDRSIADREMLYVYTLVPSLAGFHFEHPVFFFSDKEKNEPFAVSGEPTYTQGSLLIFPASEELEGRIQVSLVTNVESLRFFNHTLVPMTVQATESRWHLQPVGVMRGGTPHAMMWLWKPVKITSPDHVGEDIELPEGNWLALHPFPRRGMD